MAISDTILGFFANLLFFKTAKIYQRTCQLNRNDISQVVGFVLCGIIEFYQQNKYSATYTNTLIKKTHVIKTIINLL